MPLAAVIVNEYDPAGTVLAIVITPLELSILTPDGAALLNEYVIGNVPVAITWNVPPTPVTTVVLSSLVMFGATEAADTVKEKVCGVLNNELLAVIVNVCKPIANAPLPAIFKKLLESILTPEGAPDNVKVIGGDPVAVSWNDPPTA